MNLYINGRFFTQSITGVQRYACELVKTLDKLIETDLAIKEHKYIIVCPQNTQYSLDLKNIKIKKIGFLKGHLWEQIELPLYTRDGFLINLCNVAPIVKKNQILTIHDAAVYACPKGFSKLFIWWYKLIFFILGTRLEYMITVSEFSKRELIRYCKISADQIHVIYLGVEHILNIVPDRKVIEKYDLQNKKFILAVSSMNHNKNFKMVIEVAKKNSQYLFVIAGGINSNVFSSNKLDLPKNLKYIGYITDEELVALYSYAGCFIYPSLYEGFGLPPLEAMAYGCPVIVSCKASLPEVCGNGGLYCDPYSSEDIAEKLHLILENEIIRKDLSWRGRERVKVFSWEKCARNLMQVIKP